MKDSQVSRAGVNEAQEKIMKETDTTNQTTVAFPFCLLPQLR